MDTVIGIIERKKQGIDCTEAESAEIKGWLKETIILPESGDIQIQEDIQELFPQEYGEYLDETETPEELFARENAESIFQIAIEGEFLYDGNDAPEDFMKSIIDDPEHSAIIKENMRIGILTDVLAHPESFARNTKDTEFYDPDMKEGQLTYDYTMMDYDGHITAYCDKLWNEQHPTGTKPSFTKGEWLFKGDEIYSQDGRSIARMLNNDLMKANARLIIASPDLLNALQVLHDAYKIIAEHHGVDYPHSLTYRIVEDALYKAIEG